VYSLRWTVPASARHTAAKTCSATSDCLTPLRTGTRISTSRELPKVCTWTSPRPSASTACRVFCTSALCAYSTSTSVPPVNSIDRFRPRVARKNTAMTKATTETALSTRV